MRQSGRLRLQHHWISDLRGDGLCFFDSRGQLASGDRNSGRSEELLAAVLGDGARGQVRACGSWARSVVVGLHAAGVPTYVSQCTEGAVGRREERNTKFAELIHVGGIDLRAFVQTGEDDGFGWLDLAQRGEDGRELQAAGYLVGQDDGQDEASVLLVGQDRRDAATVEVRIDQALRCNVERIGGRDEVWQLGSQGVSGSCGEGRQREAKAFAQVQRKSFERAGFCEDCRATRGQRRTAGEDVGYVYQLFERVHNNDAGMRHLGAHQVVIAGHGAGVGRSGGTRGAAAAGVEQHDSLTGGSSYSGQFQQLLWLAKLLDDHRNHVRVFVGDHVLEELFDAACCFVPGGDRIGDL